MARLHDLVGGCAGEAADEAEVVVGIETDRGPWVGALLAAGYAVFPVNPLQASRYRERHGVSGAKSDGGDAHMLADMVRTDSHQLRAAAGHSPEAEAIKVMARTRHEPHVTQARQDARAVTAAMAPLKALRERPASYLNETDYFQADWQTAFWGHHYPRLTQVKDHYDPGGLFFVHHGVGTGTRSADGFTKRR